MTKYNEQFKLKIVKQFLAGGSSIRALCDEHGVTRTVVRRWIASYRLHGLEGLRKKFTHYDAQFKLSVLLRMRREHLSYDQVAAALNIRHPGSIATWERRYHAGGI